jgi:mono/diheme cytochrome c family protein
MSKMAKFMKRRYQLLWFVLLFANILSAQEWIVPAENAAKLSPFAFSDSTRKVGGDLYNINCKSCHGDPGKNNAVKLVPPPPDATSAQMQKNTDGGLFYKVSEGRVLMPSFKNTVSAADLWRIISFIRSFNNTYKQEVAPKPVAGSFLEKVNFVITWDKDWGQVQVAVTSLKELMRIPVPGAELKLFAKRYFGNLPIGETKTTDNQGIALFNFPANLPGDSAGVVTLLVQPVDQGAFGETKAEASLAIGVPTNRPPLNEQRALWNVVQKTPVWLLLTYIVTVLTVWGFIVYVMLQLRAIFKYGSDQNPAK